MPQPMRERERTEKERRGDKGEVERLAARGRQPLRSPQGYRGGYALPGAKPEYVNPHNDLDTEANFSSDPIGDLLLEQLTQREFERIHGHDTDKRRPRR